MSRPSAALVMGLFTLSTPVAIGAQQLAVEDPVVRAIWAEGTERSQVYPLAQTLMDSLGPRLTGTPQSQAASDWVLSKYASWGIEGYAEPYGTWNGWRRGPTHVDLVEPRGRTLDATMLAWSPGTDGPVTGSVVPFPAISSAAEFESFLGGVRGKFVLLSAAEPTCRPDANWEEFAPPGSLERMTAARTAAAEGWNRRLQATGLGPTGLQQKIVARLEEAGAAGILTSRWSQGWGVQKIFSASSTSVPTLDVSCEDYGLLFRLAEHGQGPVLRVDARSEDLGQVAVANTIGVLPGSELPDQYVVLSAHFDSWDGGTGATDNGTGSIVVVEAMRILAQSYPRPRRTILAGLWNGEEQGLNGSRAFAADHPEIVEGLQALFNHDHGTGRAARISMQGLTEAGAFFGRWFAALPQELSSQIELGIPGSPASGGTDNASFVCYGVPAFSVGAVPWDYNVYTWHTNRDTFDKVVTEEVASNARLMALLAYMASEEPSRIPRDRRMLPADPDTGRPTEWPSCRDGQRSAG